MSSILQTPAISRVLEDGTILDLVYDPIAETTAFAIGRPDGSSSIEPLFSLPSGEQLAPYSPKNNLIANDCVLLPSDIGDFGDVGDLVEAVQAFLHRYVDLSPVFEEIAAHYVLLSWVYDAFSDLPYLRLRGDYGTGKTRGLLTIGSLCYKAFFASGASTVSPIFHIQDAFQGTLVLDEADFRFSDQTAELTKVLNNGTTRGLPVLRTMTNRNKELNPTAFRVFGPKIVAMRERFADKALESRFLSEETGQWTPRAGIPVHLPPAFWGEARALRNRLLSWRFNARRRVQSDPSRLPNGISPRLKQSSLALLSVIGDAGVRERVCKAIEGEEAHRRAERADTHEAAVLSAIAAVFGAGVPVSVGAVTERFNEQCAAELGQPMTQRWVGHVVRRRLGLATQKSGGVYVIPPTERPKLAALARRFGVEDVL